MCGNMNQKQISFQVFGSVRYAQTQSSPVVLCCDGLPISAIEGGVPVVVCGLSKQCH